MLAILDQIRAAFEEAVGGDSATQAEAAQRCRKLVAQARALAESQAKLAAHDGPEVD